MSSERIHVVSAAIVRSSGDHVPASLVLLAQRAADTSFPLTWCTPGGKVEPWESPLDALRRELYEELGIVLQCSIQPSELYAVELDPPSVRKAIRVTCYRIALTHMIGLPWAGDKTAGVGWFNAKDLRQLELAPADKAGRSCLIDMLEVTP